MEKHQRSSYEWLEGHIKIESPSLTKAATAPDALHVGRERGT